MRHKNRTDFTLIELLLVISIISILLSLTLPALKKAKNSGVKVQCANQMKQMTLGIFNYIDDSEGFVPYLKLPFKSFRTVLATSSISSIERYFPSQLLDCPGDRTRVSTIDYWPYPGYGNISYSYNAHLIAGNNTAESYYQSRRTHQFKIPSQDILLYETGSNMGCNMHAQTAPTAGSASYYLNESNHENGNNFPFLDGHTSFFTYQNFLNKVRHEGDIYQSASWGFVPYSYLP